MRVSRAWGSSVRQSSGGSHLKGHDSQSQKTIRGLTVLPTTGLLQAKKMTKINTGCVCVEENFLWNPTCFPAQHFSLSFPLSLPISPCPHSPPSIPPSRHPSCLYFLTVHAVLRMPSARVRGQLSQQRLYCVAHMEKITTTGQFSPWSYVNSFDGMSGLSPICGGMVEGIRGFHCSLNTHPLHQ